MPVQFYARANPNASPLRVKVLGNYFCKTCGIFTYIGDGEITKDGYRINLGSVEGLDPLALEISIIDGKSVPLVEEPR